MASPVTRRSVSSYLAFPPLLHIAAVYLCCTILEVAPTGRYPAPLPCEARTFLSVSLSLSDAAIICPALNLSSLHDAFPKVKKTVNRAGWHSDRYIHAFAHASMAQSWLHRGTSECKSQIVSCCALSQSEPVFTIRPIGLLAHTG